MGSSPTKGRLSTGTKRLFLLLVVPLVLVLMLLAAEAAVRLRHQMKYGSAGTIETFYTLDRKLGLRVPIPNLSSKRISTNSLGFRGPELPVQKSAGTVRLAFLGASTTWCAEVSGNEHVWPHLVSASLAQTFPDTRFDYVNAAVPGYTMGSLLKSMEHRVAPLQPDVVVIYEAANNLSGEMRERAAQQGLIDSPEWESFSWPSRYSLLWNLVEKNLRVLNSQRRARSNLEVLLLEPQTFGREYREALTRVVLAAKAHAKVVALATFSIHPRKDQSRETQLHASGSAFVYMPFVTPEVIIQGYERYNRIIREVAAETGALLIDGETEIPGDFLHFTDTVHFTDAGSKAMAARVARALASSPELRPVVTAAGAR